MTRNCVRKRKASTSISYKPWSLEARRDIFSFFVSAEKKWTKGESSLRKDEVKQRNRRIYSSSIAVAKTWAETKLDPKVREAREEEWCISSSNWRCIRFDREAVVKQVSLTVVSLMHQKEEEEWNEKPAPVFQEKKVIEETRRGKNEGLEKWHDSLPRRETFFKRRRFIQVVQSQERKRKRNENSFHENQVKGRSKLSYLSPKVMLHWKVIVNGRRRNLEKESLDQSCLCQV